MADKPKTALELITKRRSAVLAIVIAAMSENYSAGKGYVVQGTTFILNALSIRVTSKNRSRLNRDLAWLAKKQLILLIPATAKGMSSHAKMIKLAKGKSIDDLKAFLLAELGESIEKEEPKKKSTKKTSKKKATRKKKSVSQKKKPAAPQEAKNKVSDIIQKTRDFVKYLQRSINELDEQHRVLLSAYSQSTKESDQIEEQLSASQKRPDSQIKAELKRVMTLKAAVSRLPESLKTDAQKRYLADLEAQQSKLNDELKEEKPDDADLKSRWDELVEERRTLSDQISSLSKDIVDGEKILQRLSDTTL